MAYRYVLQLGLLLFLSEFSLIVEGIDSSTTYRASTQEPGIDFLGDAQGQNTTALNSGIIPTQEPTPQPEGNYTLEPNPEPEKNETASSEPEDGKAEPEKGQPEPEGGDAEPEAEGSFAEPGPEWEEAKMQWKAAWELHVYVFGSLFTILGLYCLISVIRLWKINRLLSRNYFLTLNVLNITVCILRALYLFIDAYNSHGTFPAIVDYFLYSTVLPCLTALFSVLFYALLLATRVRIMSQKVQSLRVLIAIIAFHFLLSFITDIVVGVHSQGAVLIFICQVFYVIWGLLMFIGYFFIFKRMYQGVLKRQNQVTKRSQKINANGSVRSDKVHKSKHSIGLAVKITLAAALFGVACVGFQLFGMFGVYGVIGDYRTPSPWAWWVYHTGQRLLEFLMCFSIAVVSLQPLKLAYKNKKHQTLICLLPCCLSCYQDTSGEGDEPTSSSINATSMTESKVLKLHV